MFNCSGSLFGAIWRSITLAHGTYLGPIFMDDSNVLVSRMMVGGWAGHFLFSRRIPCCLILGGGRVRGR
ncbi:hypothetical protein VTJ04DRAFT_8602 [Mycothermus thermophilus]|uniref:uncharacterized protein n=1 Tax=Humicola insolens TaxID=85995 RepID=UPI0037425592